MKRNIILICCLLLCLILLGGCACEHTWVDANCIAPKTCSSCGEIEGEPLGHAWVDANCIAAKTCSSCGETEGEPLGHTWTPADCITSKTCSVCNTVEGEPLGHTIAQQQEKLDVIAATVNQLEYCTVCNEQLSCGTVPLETMIKDGMFLFTPNEFMERFAVFTDKYVHTFSCEFTILDVGLAAFVSADDQNIIVQFFGSDTAPLTVNDLDSRAVWCVSLSQFGEQDEKLQQSFLMACDPALTKDTAYRVNVGIAAATQSAAYAGEPFAYTLYNGLLYEASYAYWAMPDADEMTLEMLEMLNVYASDFREDEKQETIIELKG